MQLCSSVWLKVCLAGQFVCIYLISAGNFTCIQALGNFTWQNAMWTNEYLWLKGMQMWIGMWMNLKDFSRKAERSLWPFYSSIVEFLEKITQSKLKPCGPKGVKIKCGFEMNSVRSD